MSSDASRSRAAVLVPGDRPQLFVDDVVLQSVQGGHVRMHHPQPADVVIEHDQPWEGDACNFHTVFRDGDQYRMFYRGAKFNERFRCDASVFATALSNDGLHWHRPMLGLHAFQGSTHNNIIWTGLDGYAHDFSPFRDDNPAAPPHARYKTANRGKSTDGNYGLYAWQSPDGLHWSLMQPAPVITGMLLDTQNITFWDAQLGRYRAYVRDFRQGDIPAGDDKNGLWRDIRTATSTDFLHWDEPRLLEYGPRNDSIHMYTNQVHPYPRDPGLYIGFPARYIDRGPSPSFDHLPDADLRRRRGAVRPRLGTAVTDTLIMFSRDGVRFHRWTQAFLRPGHDRWNYGDNYLAWQLVQTGDREFSLYATENYMTGRATRLRRFTLRVDGFFSVQSDTDTCVAVTRPLICAGEFLGLNFATSGAGFVQVQALEPESEQPLEHANSGPLLGDDIDRPVHLPGLRTRIGQPIRLRFSLLDADLFSFRFQSHD